MQAQHAAKPPVEHSNHACIPIQNYVSFYDYIYIWKSEKENEQVLIKM